MHVAPARVSDPLAIGREIGRIILDVGDDELAITEKWHVRHSTARD